MKSLEEIAEQMPEQYADMLSETIVAASTGGQFSADFSKHAEHCVTENECFDLIWEMVERMEFYERLLWGSAETWGDV